MSHAMVGKEVGEEDWEAVQRLMGGVMPIPAIARKWGERETKMRVFEVVEALGEVQDWAWETVRGWREQTKERVHAYVKIER